MTERSRALLERFAGRLRLPLVAAPMFLVSGPELVQAVRREGVIGSFPFPNARTLETLEEWLEATTLARNAESYAPLAANMITHSSYDRLTDELELIKTYRPEIVITALGGPKPVLKTVHAYGGLVFADVNSVGYARKAAEAGADGLVLVSSGAGGHTGQMSALSFVSAVREFFDGVVVLAGGVATGRAVRAAEILGADLAYAGTAFIAAEESLAPPDYRSMVVAATIDDLVLSNKLTGANAYYLKASLERAGFDLSEFADKTRPDLANSQRSIKAWRDVWSAGHGVGAIRKIQPAREIIRTFCEDYWKAAAAPASYADRRDGGYFSNGGRESDV